MNVLRERNQKGSLQVRSHGKRKMWVWLYREDGSRKYVTLGPSHKMTKAQAEVKRDQALSRSPRSAEFFARPGHDVWAVFRWSGSAILSVEVEELDSVH